LVGFLTLTLTAFIFLFAVYHFEQNNREIFQRVGSNIENIELNNELNRLLVTLELDIRNLITIILREPHRLTRAKARLKKQFEAIYQKAVEAEPDPTREKFLGQLGRYRDSLDNILWDYGAINASLYEVYYSVNSFSESLRYMEETAGQLMINMALQGKNTDALQQAYVLITIAYENILQVHIMVNSSLANNDSTLLGFNDNKPAKVGEQNVLDKIVSLTNTVRTLTAADESIAYYANTILDTLPLFKENIHELARLIDILNQDNNIFSQERDRCLLLLNDLNVNNSGRMRGIVDTIRFHERQSMVTAWLIAVAVLLVSVGGLLITRRMSRQLELTTLDAIRARDEVETLNEQLYREVEARQQNAEKLRQARDELELRVKERTAELSSSNRSLALEIEERINAEHALAAEKERLAVTLRSIGEGVITCGVDGTVVLVNKVAEELTGWTQQEASGVPLGTVFQLINKKSGTACENPVDVLVRSGRIYNLDEDTVLLAKDGTRRDIANSCAPIRDQESRIVGAVLVFRDVTNRKRMEEEVLKAEKLKSVGVLAGGIAHDFNNILAAILGNISLAKLDLAQGDDDKVRQLLEDAEKASLRARNLTQQLLTFSKGGEPIRRVESIAEIIKDCADFILSGGKVHCRYSLAEDIWPVNIDTGQMSQVIQNIIINAMHAMPDGGTIEISGDNLVNDHQQIPSLPAGNYVRIALRDEGTGIPEELLNKIFDPYFTTKEEGSGLGLALTHSIITKHQGLIQVESGTWGSCFTIFLPALPEHEVEEQAAPSETVTRTGQARVLIMDDEPMVRDIARDMLLHLGYDVETAANGQEAIEIYQAAMGSDSPIDLVIMDLTIPGGMGGREAVRRLAEMNPAVKAIVSSGYSNDPVMSDYRQYGFSGMVYKPFQLSELLESIIAVLGPLNGKPEQGKG